MSGANIAIIPARGNSQRIPKKAIRFFHGKPIIQYAIDAAKEAGMFDEIVVSTDCMDIAEVAFMCGAGVLMRDADMSVDEVGTQAVAKHVVERIQKNHGIKVDTVCVIYPCSPMLTAFHIQKGYFELDNEEVDYSFSVGTVPKLHDAGNFYWCKSDALLAQSPLFAERSVMIPIEPERTCDINTVEDFHKAEKMYLELKGGKNAA